jgi:Tol biopolymer transport system component
VCANYTPRAIRPADFAELMCDSRRPGASPWPMMRDPIRCVLVVLCLAACGGGGDDDGGPEPDDGPGAGGGEDGGDDGGDGGAGLPSDVNGELRGVLYFDGPTEYVELDLSSSRRTVVRSRGGDVSDDMTPSEDASEFVATDDPLSGALDATDLLITDRDGGAVLGFEFAEGLGRPKLSPDGAHIALTLNDVPCVLDRDGEIVAELAQFEGAQDLEWTPDGRLLVAFGDTIHELDAALSDTSVLAEFPGDAPDFLAVSPDGSQLAFDLGDPLVTENHVFVMNMDGTGLRQLTTSELNEDAPTWSPDGRWIIVRWGIVTEFGEEITCPELWAVPADAERAVVSGEGSGGAFLVQELEDGDPRNVCAFSPPEWRSAPEPLPATPGTLPAGDGINAGLSGRVVFDGFDYVGDEHTAGFVDLDVASGSDRLVPLSSKVASSAVAAPWLSRDGEELAFWQGDPDSGELGIEQITIQRLDGTRTAAFEQPDSFAGQPKISPDGQLVAIEWHSIDLGDEGGVPVVTVFDRTGAVQVRFERTNQWDWLPDGRLVLADGNVIFVTDKALDKATEVAALPDAIGAMQVSPDGERLAFAMNGHVWTMGTDGSGLRRMTSGRLAVGAPAWSPDGRFLAVQTGDLCPEVYIVPADAERLSVADPLVTPTAMELRKLDDDGDPGALCAFSLMTWR